MASRQVSFSHPIGTAFHQAVVEAVSSMRQGGESTIYAEVAADLLMEGLGHVKLRGVLSDGERFALILEKHIKQIDPKARSVTINYAYRDAIKDAVDECMTTTTLNGPRKVLKEAIVMYLKVNGKLPTDFEGIEI